MTTSETHPGTEADQHFEISEIEAIFHQSKRLQALLKAAGDDRVSDPKALRALAFIHEGTRTSSLCEGLANAIERDELNKIVGQFERAAEDAAVSVEGALSNIRLHMKEEGVYDRDIEESIGHATYHLNELVPKGQKVTASVIEDLIERLGGKGRHIKPTFAQTYLSYVLMSKDVTKPPTPKGR